MNNTEELQSKISLLEEKVKNLEKGQFKSITTRRINIVDVDEVDDYYDYEDPEFFDTTNDLDKDFGLFMYSKENDLLYSHGFVSFPGERLDDDDDADMSVLDEDYEDGDAETTHITTNYYHLDDDNKKYNKRPRVSVGQCGHGAGQIRLNNHKANEMIFLGTLRRCHSGRIVINSGDNDGDFTHRYITLTAGNHSSHPVSQDNGYSDHGLAIIAKRGEDYKGIRAKIVFDEEYSTKDKIRVEAGDDDEGSWTARLEKSY